MNTSNKNVSLDNSWILCPSKTFPGKYYYFNVRNGKTAWSNEIDKQNICNDTTVADRFHNYPEPTSFPVDTIGPQSCQITPNFNKPNDIKTISCSQNIPTFAQTFPNYVGNAEISTPSVVCTVQMPISMFQLQSKHPLTDQVTQTSPMSMFPAQIKQPLFNRITQTSPIPNFCPQTQQTVFDKVTQTLFDKVTQTSPKFSPQTEPSMVDKIVQNPKLESPKIGMDEEELNSLDKSDLRFLLLAKRRKAVDAEDTVVERKKSKPPEVTPVTPKKKVTFDLSDISDETMLSHPTEQENFICQSPNYTTQVIVEQPRSPILGLKETNFKKSTPISSSNFEPAKEIPAVCQQDNGIPLDSSDAWYIVVDTDILLLHNDLLDKLVLSDNKCKFLIPHAVRADVEALCVGDSRGQQRVINARQISRRLATPPPHYIVEPGPDKEEDIVLTTDSILQCCINAVNDNYYVVLITNDPYLQAKASALHIANYKLNDIINGVDTKTDVTSQLNGTQSRLIKIFNEINLDSTNDQIDNKETNNVMEIFKKPEMTSTQCRLKKIFNNLNLESTDNKEQNNKTNDTGIFKVPQPLQFENRTRNRSVPDGSSEANDKIQTRGFKNTDSVDETLKRFCVKSKVMSQKLSSRMDEWICSYIQIMEDVLNQILQKNSVCMKNTVAPLTLHDTINCIKMLYGSHTKIRDAVDNSSDFINRCIHKKEKHNNMPLLNPDQFMKMFAYGFLLIISLEEVLPQSEDLIDAESRLSSLLSNIESTAVDIDPELLKTPYISCVDVDDKDGELRSNFTKEPSYVLNYLKKHYKAWASSNEDSLNDSCKTQNHSNVKVVRTIGKNINLLKFDSSKALSHSKTIVDADPIKKNKDKPEIISSIKVDHINKLLVGKKENHTIDMNENEIKLNKPNKEQNIVLKNTDNINENDVTKSKYFTTKNVTNNPETDLTKVMKLINKKGQDSKNTKNIEEIDFSNPGHTFMQNTEITGPKVMRNMKLIDEYEKKIKNRQLLDLDLLDYSETYEPSVKNVDSNKVCDNTEKVVNKELNNTKSALTDFTKDINLDDRDKFYMSPILQSKNYSFKLNKNLTDNIDNKNKTESFNNNYYFCPISNGNTKNNENKTTNGGTEHTYNDNIGNNNDSCIDNDNSEIHNDISDIHNDISEIHNDNFEINQSDSFDKGQIRNDSPNDSGFENDSTYAHSVVKIFLQELSTSFKVIYEFVNKFIIEIHEIESCEIRKNIVRNQARKSLEDMTAIIKQLRSIIKRESADDTVLRTLLLKAGVEATTDKRITRYKQIVMKSLEQALIFENALKIIASTTRGEFEFDAISTNAQSSSSKEIIKYFNIFEQS